MKFFIIVIIFVFIVLIFAGIFIYYNYEKPISEQNVTYSDINLASFYKDKFTSTNYVIMLGSMDNIYKNGSTLSSGFEVIRVPINNTVYIYNNNTEDQNYYPDLRKLEVYSKGPYRVELDLVNPGTLNIKNLTDSYNKNSSIEVVSTGLFKSLKLCVKWSLHILKVNVKDIESCDKPKKYVEYDRCYCLKRDLSKNEKLKVEFDYTYFGVLDSRDFIDLTFFDNDLENNRKDKEYTYKVKY